MTQTVYRSFNRQRTTKTYSNFSDHPYFVCAACERRWKRLRPVLVACILAFAVAWIGILALLNSPSLLPVAFAGWLVGSFVILSIAPWFVVLRIFAPKAPDFSLKQKATRERQTRSGTPPRGTTRWVALTESQYDKLRRRQPFERTLQGQGLLISGAGSSARARSKNFSARIAACLLQEARATPA